MLYGYTAFAQYILFLAATVAIRYATVLRQGNKGTRRPRTPNHHISFRAPSSSPHPLARILLGRNLESTAHPSHFLSDQIPFRSL